MSDQGALFDAGSALLPHQGGPENTSPKKLARSSDPATSRVAAQHAAYRSGSQKARLLEVYRDAEPDGLTDEQAAKLTGMERHAATKRCSDLRNDGMIESVGVAGGRSGLPNQVCRVAEAHR